MSYIFGGNTGVSYEDLQKRRAIAQGLMQREGMRQPQYALEGLAQGGAAIVGALLDRKAAKKEGELREDFNSDFAGLFGGGGFGGAQPANAPAPRGDMEQYRNAIASIESAGSGDYQAVGPTNSKLGRALGRYQIMEANIGPWSREALGREVTPDEFLANPELQDAIFDHKFGGYVEQYGPEGAAQAWFAGPGGVGKMGRSDVLGTSVADYTQKFSSALGGAPVASGGGSGNNVQRIARIVAMADSPMASPAQKAIAQTLLQREMQSGDPMRALELERAQLEIEALRNPQPGYSQVRGADLGLTGPQADMMFNRGPDGKITQIGGGGTTINNNMPGAGPELGKLSTDFGYVLDPATGQPRIDPATGLPMAAPVPGSPAAREIATTEEKKSERERQKAIGLGPTLTNIQMNIDEIQDGGLPVTGLFGAVAGLAPGTAASDWRVRNEQITTEAALNEVQNMRDNSPTGGAVGQLTDSERQALAVAASGLSNAQSKGEYIRAAETYRKTMLDTAYGQGNWSIDDKGQVSLKSSTPSGQGGGFSNATMADLLAVDIMSLTPAQEDEWERRMLELQGGQ